MAQNAVARLRQSNVIARARHAAHVDLLPPVIPGVAYTCLVALGTLSANRAVAAAFAEVTKDGEAVGLSAGQGCATSIVITHQCHMQYDWSPYTADLSAYTAASSAADPTSKLCSVDLTATELIEPFGSVTLVVTEELWLAVPGACTAIDRAALLSFYQAQATSSANLTDVSFEWHNGCPV